MRNGTKIRMRTRHHHSATGQLSDRSLRSTARPNQANAKRSYERYLELARAAASTGGTIEAENLHQHAEHYFRLMRDVEV